MSSSASSSSRNRSRRQRTGEAPQQVQGPFTVQFGEQQLQVPYVEVQRLKDRGARCRAPGMGGFVKCPEQIRQANPELFAQSRQAPRSQAEMDIRTDPESGQHVSVENIAGRGLRCRGQNRNGRFGKFVKCSDALKQQLAQEFGDAAVFGRASGPKSPIEYATGSNGMRVRIQWMTGRGWRCRGEEGSEEAGQFIACPDALREELLNRPPPAGQEPLRARGAQVATSSQSRSRSQSFQGSRAASPIRASSPRASSPRASQGASLARASQGTSSMASSVGQSRLAGQSRLVGQSRLAGGSRGGAFSGARL